MREDIYKLEETYLSPFAVKSKDTKGREREIEPCKYRTDFQRDRDRIIHSKAFRRLKHKTQVFISPEGDHFRTRLTHTLEVTQIARTISRALFLNEDLTEAIALGHDLGHTPFGHTGERVLAEKTNGEFSHNRQSLRVVERLENDGKGLNLTWEVRDGILNHRLTGHAATLEGKVVAMSDKIAYINHDIEDAVAAELLSLDMLPEAAIKILGDTREKRINTLVYDAVENSKNGEIRMSGAVSGALMTLREFLFDNLYIKNAAGEQEQTAEKLVASLYDRFLNAPLSMPEFYVSLLQSEPVSTVVCDYIAGMSDRYAMKISGVSINTIY